jgi:hypothetical protein
MDSKNIVPKASATSTADNVGGGNVDAVLAASIAVYIIIAVPSAI